MTTQYETLACFSSRLATLVYPGVTFIYPDKVVSPLPPLPLVLLEIIPVSTQDPTMGGGSEVDIGHAMVHAVTAGGDFGQESAAIAKLIKNLFPYPTRITIGSTTVLINRPPEVQAGYDDGLGWRVPTKLYYNAT